MIAATNSLLRRHRRLALAAACTLLVGLGALGVHAASMGPRDGHMGDLAGVCLILGTGVAVLGAAAVAARRLPGGWSPVVLFAPVPPDAPAPGSIHPARAGPPPAALQVFRL